MHTILIFGEQSLKLIKTLVKCEKKPQMVINTNLVKHNSFYGFKTAIEN